MTACTFLSFLVNLSPSLAISELDIPFRTLPAYPKASFSNLRPVLNPIIRPIMAKGADSKS